MEIKNIKQLKEKALDQKIDLRIAKKFWKLEHQKLKYFENPFVNVSITSSVALDSLFSISQGTTDITRIGDKTIITAIDVLLAFSSVTTAAFNQQTLLRFVLFFWNIDDTDASPTSLELINPGSAASVVFPLNVDSIRQKKITILHDEAFWVGADCNAVHFIRKKFLLNKKVGFVGSNSTGLGKPYVLLVSGSNTYTPFVNGDIRIEFCDTL